MAINPVHGIVEMVSGQLPEAWSTPTATPAE
jgi:hypothetical protein